MSFVKGETLRDISGWLRSLVRANWLSSNLTVEGVGVIEKFEELAERIDAAEKRDAEMIERIVRDAIISYEEAYPRAPNDDCERELKERAEIANKWLKDHGFEEEKVMFDKEEVSCC